jgi:hypothetical protein
MIKFSLCRFPLALHMRGDNFLLVIRVQGQINHGTGLALQRL